MDKRIAGSIFAALVIAGSTSFMASAAMVNGTVVIGSKAFDLEYANNPTNINEIASAITSGGNVYVKGFDGYWINNITNAQEDAKSIPAVVYKSASGEANFDAGDEDCVNTVTIKSVNAINTINSAYGLSVANLALPTKVTLLLSDNTIKDVSVAWTSITYDASKSASYIFTGVYALPSGVSGTMPVVTANVVVGLKPNSADTIAAKAVEDKIIALPALNALTLSSKAGVVAARSAYTALTGAQKVLVTKLSTLTAAEGQLITLQAAADDKVAEDAAEVAVKVAETSRMNVDVDKATEVVQAVKDVTKNTEFNDRIAKINPLNEVVSKGNNSYLLTDYNTSLNDFIDKEMSDTPAASIDGQWRYAAIKDGQLGYCTNPSNISGTWVYSPTDYNYIKTQLINNVDPLNLEDDSVKVYQFVVLNYTDCTTADELNSMFGDNNALTGKGQVFMDAAKANNVNPIYLAAHAILETGHGTSILANGGTTEITGEYTYGVPVYNLFGIGAVDSAPDAGGTKTAYQNGWTSVDLAINGGAAWIAKGYICDYQNTLYKMRWNSLNIYHQYATDVNWADNQLNSIKQCFDLFPNAKLTFEIPTYN